MRLSCAAGLLFGLASRTVPSTAAASRIPVSAVRNHSPRLLVCSTRFAVLAALGSAHALGMDRWRFATLASREPSTAGLDTGHKLTWRTKSRSDRELLPRSVIGIPSAVPSLLKAIFQRHRPSPAIVEPARLVSKGGYSYHLHRQGKNHTGRGMFPTGVCMAFDVVAPSLIPVRAGDAVKTNCPRREDVTAPGFLGALICP